MNKLHGSLMAGVLLLAIGGTACTRNSADLAQLDSAYKARVLSKDEYDSKKAAMENNADAMEALDRARAAGVLTDDEYRDRKSALLASGLPSASAVQAEAPAQNVPVNAATQNGAVSDVAGGPQDHYYRMKPVRVMDEHGFERPIPSSSLLLPVDWQSQGGTNWVLKDSCNPIQTSFRATAPDGRAFEVFPTYKWVWADDPTFLRQSAAQKAQFGSKPCDVMPPMNAEQFIRRNLPQLRPGAQFVRMDPVPKALEKLQQQAQQSEQMAARYGLRERVTEDLARGRVRYNVGGKPVEEWIVTQTTVVATLGPSFSGGRATQAYSYNCAATTYAARAPEGQLDSSEKLFGLIVGNIRVDQAWLGRVTKVNSNIQANAQAEIRKRSEIVAQNSEDIRNIQKEGYENQQRGEDQSFAQFDQNIRDVETFRDPNTGDTVELSNQYGHAWVNNQGEYLLSDQEGFDPNTTFKGSWTSLEPVKPQ